MQVGVLALQGGVTAHADVLRALGHDVVLVRNAAQFSSLDGLVLPGGESSTMLKFLAWDGLDEPLDAFVRSGKPVLATCAGLILSARQVSNPEQRSFGWLDVAVTRNGWGRQLDSFQAHADAAQRWAPALPLMFIRAPRITELGEGVVALAHFDGEPILVQQGSVTAATFHPELTGDTRVHAMVFGTETHAQ